MKRIPLFLMIAVSLVLAACSQNQEPSAAAGNWDGQLQVAGGGTVPLSFEVDAQGRINEGTFDASFESEDFSWSIVSEVTETSISIDATASHVDLGTVTFTLDGSISGDTITGTWNLTASNDDGTFNASGSFTATRSAAD